MKNKTASASNMMWGGLVGAGLGGYVGLRTGVRSERFKDESGPGQAGKNIGNMTMTGAIIGGAIGTVVGAFLEDEVDTKRKKRKKIASTPPSTDPGGVPDLSTFPNANLLHIGLRNLLIGSVAGLGYNRLIRSDKDKEGNEGMRDKKVLTDMLYPGIGYAGVGVGVGALFNKGLDNLRKFQESQILPATQAQRKDWI
jgi:MFS family permease